MMTSNGTFSHVVGHSCVHIFQYLLLLVLCQSLWYMVLHWGPPIHIYFNSIVSSTVIVFTLKILFEWLFSTQNLGCIYSYFSLSIPLLFISLFKLIYQSIDCIIVTCFIYEMG